jgi:hypothetical protein
MTLMANINCNNCDRETTVRQADIDRGWGKFCSKSCKATYQENSKSKPNSFSTHNKISYLGGKIFEQNSHIFK